MSKISVEIFQKNSQISWIYIKQEQKFLNFLPKNQQYVSPKKPIDSNHYLL